MNCVYHINLGVGYIPCGAPFFGQIFVVVVAFHPGGRSSRRMLPLPHNVNEGKKMSGGKNVSESPPPVQRLFQAWRSIAAFGLPALPFHKSWIRHCFLTAGEDHLWTPGPPGEPWL